MPEILSVMTALVWTHTKGAETEAWSSDHVNYGVKDAKGRAVGGYALITHRVGTSDYSVCTKATRDGRGFGALPRRAWATSLEPAQALAVKKLLQAKARYERLAAKGEGKQWASKRGEGGA
jgi:hypothetical protein